MGRANGVAVPGLAVHGPAGVPIDGVVADQLDRPVGDDVFEQEPHQGAAEREAGPGCSGQDAAVTGNVSGCQLAEGAQQVGDGAPAGRQDGSGQERGEPLVGGAGEVESENLYERVRLGW